MTIDERLARMMETLQMQASLAAEEQKRHEAKMAEHAQLMATRPNQTDLEREHAKTERTLRWAIRSYAREERKERKWRQELESRSKSSPNTADAASIDSPANALSYGKRGQRAMTIEERLEGMTQTLELQISLQADAHKDHEDRMAKLELSQAKTDRALRRAIDLSVRGMRNERKQRQELDKRLQELAESADRRHAELEATFKKFMERSGNGQH